MHAFTRHAHKHTPCWSVMMLEFKSSAMLSDSATHPEYRRIEISNRGGTKHMPHYSFFILALDFYQSLFSDKHFHQVFHNYLFLSFINILITKCQKSCLIIFFYSFFNLQTNGISPQQVNVQLLQTNCTKFKIIASSKIILLIKKKFTSHPRPRKETLLESRLWSHTQAAQTRRTCPRT